MDAAAALVAFGAAAVGAAGGSPMDPRIKPAWPGARLAAPAFTVRCAPGDNLAVHVAAAQAPSGNALVVDATADPARGYWGEVLTTAAEARGLSGLVIDGGVRDVKALSEHGFPVFSALVALPGASKDAGGEVAVPVVVGGVDVAPGDWVVGDADGVVVVPAEDLDHVLAAAAERVEREQRMFEDLRAGRTTLDLLGLDADRVEGAQ